MTGNARRPLTVAEIDQLEADEFVEALGWIFETSPHLARTAWASRPFADRGAIAAAFDRAAETLDRDDRLALLRAHPVLGARQPMAVASQREQAAAGLANLDEVRRARIADNNARYLERFGFPFILAVRGLTVADIDAALTGRLANDPEQELTTAFDQVRRIGALRIEQAVIEQGVDE